MAVVGSITTRRNKLLSFHRNNTKSGIEFRYLTYNFSKTERYMRNNSNRFSLTIVLYAEYSVKWKSLEKDAYDSREFNSYLQK